MKLLLAATIPGWHSLDGSRQTQHFRNELVKALQIITNGIANNGTDAGGVNWPTVTLNFKLEPSPVEKPENEEAA